MTSVTLTPEKFTYKIITALTEESHKLTVNCEGHTFYISLKKRDNDRVKKCMDLLDRYPNDKLVITIHNTHITLTTITKHKPHHFDIPKDNDAIKHIDLYKVVNLLHPIKINDIDYLSVKDSLHMIKNSQAHKIFDTGIKALTPSAQHKSLVIDFDPKKPESIDWSDM